MEPKHFPSGSIRYDPVPRIMISRLFSRKVTCAFSRKAAVHYALIRLPESAPLPQTLLIPWPHPVRRLTLLGPELELPFEQTEAGLRVQLPAALPEEDLIAPVIRMS